MLFFYVGEYAVSKTAAAVVAEGAAAGVAVTAAGAQTVAVVFHQGKVGRVYLGNAAAADIVTQLPIQAVNAGTAGTGGKILNPKLKQRNEKEVKVAVRTGYVHTHPVAAQGTDRPNLAGRLCA